jgi:isopenicillin N synthase-like dioxygenase
MENAMSQVPVIDFTPYRSGKDKASVARAVNKACEDIGFLVIAGHGVPEGLIADMERVSHAFFDLPLQDKMAVAQPAPDVLRGYIAVAAESLSRSMGIKAAGDLNESLMIGRPDVPEEAYFRNQEAGRHFAPNLWPDAPADLRRIWSDYYREMERLAADIMRVFALALDAPENYFDDKIDNHISRVRVRCYPPVPAGAAPDQSRAGAHTDYGSLTILKPQAGAGGLQVCGKDGVWSDVPDIPGSFIINIGDLMARWTNDRWVSTLHRVVVPETDAARERRRLSVVFFHNPNYDALIECIPSCSPDGSAKYDVTPAGEYLKGKFMSAQTQHPAYTA